MFLLDDLFVRPFVSVLDALHAMALEELYDVGGIRDELKENQLLYEIGEIDEERYRERKEALREELRVAEAVHDQLRNKTIEVNT
ncbi:gas vesicle protein GvpG [Natronorarus salvus]|uniref:gas vesicle protein GvpG n=1 Tax=Natronorarus salvus TaxID=3117733 RepID=UPI002F26420F